MKRAVTITAIFALVLGAKGVTLAQQAEQPKRDHTAALGNGKHHVLPAPSEIHLWPVLI